MGRPWRRNAGVVRFTQVKSLVPQGLAGLITGAALVLATACGDDNGMHDDMHDRGPTVAPGEGASGAEIYQQNCARCHGEDGARRGAPRLSDIDDRQTMDESRAIVREGPGLMPSFEGQLSPEAIDAVVEFIHTELSGGS